MSQKPIVCLKKARNQAIIANYKKLSNENPKSTYYKRKHFMAEYLERSYLIDKNNIARPRLMVLHTETDLLVRQPHMGVA